MSIIEAMRQVVDDRIQEAWGDVVDVTEFMTDTPGFFPGGPIGTYTTRYDRAEGRYRPVYQNEADLRAIRAMSWLMVERVPMAQAWVNRLLDYTIGTGFEVTIKHENALLEKELQRFVNQTLDASKWASELEAESYVREVADGEFLGEIIQDGGDFCICTREADELTEPARARELEDYYGIDGFEPSWTFGVLTKKSRTDRPLGYHFVADDAGRDWSFVKASKVIHWKRNVRSKAKRGFSDFYKPHLYVLRADRLLTNTAEGAAIQAAIAYIVEHPPNSTYDKAESVVAKYADRQERTDPISGVNMKRRRMKPGTRIDVPNGQKYQASLLGANNSQIYISVMEAALRLAGSVHAFPEGMLTGSYQNANYASSLTAEAPFVQGRVAEQRVRAERMREMVIKCIKLAAVRGRFAKATAETWDDVTRGLTVEVTPPRVVPRNPEQHAAALEVQKRNGWVSDKTAIQELGRDVEVEVANGLKLGAAAAPGPQAGPGMPGMPGAQPPAAAEEKDGQWMGLTRRQWKQNMRAITDLIEDVKGGRITRKMAVVMLRSLGMGERDAKVLIGEAVAGKTDRIPSEDELRAMESEGSQGGNVATGKAVQEAFCPTGEGGKVDNSCAPANKGKKLFNVHGYSMEAIKADSKIPSSSHKAIEWYLSFLQKVYESDDYKALMSLAKPSDEIINTPVSQLTDEQKIFLFAYLATKGEMDKAVLASTPGSTPIEGTAAVEGWKKIGGQLGTEKAGLYEGPDGDKYYVKEPDNPERAHNEVLAAKLYRLAGASVVDAELLQIDGKKAVALRWLEDAKKLDYTDPVTRVWAQEDFAIHAWLNNRDAVGAGTENPMDNMKMATSPTTGGLAIVVVDAGGALNYSGMGGSGKKEFSKFADEWESMRNPAINKSMASVFGDMTPAQLVDSAAKLKGIETNKIHELVSKYAGPEEGDGIDLSNRLARRRRDILERAYKLGKESGVYSPKELRDKLGVVDFEGSYWHADILGNMAKDMIPEGLHWYHDEVNAAIKTAEKPKQPEETKPTPESKVKSGNVATLSPPPVVNTPANPWAPKKLAELYEAAKKGPDALNAVSLPKGTNTYAKKVLKYADQLKKELGMGATAGANHVAPVIAPEASVAKPAKPAKSETLKPVTLSKAEMPSMPEFISSNSAQVEANKAAIKSLQDLAIKGDAAALATFDHPSAKVKSYAKELASKIAEKADGSQYVGSEEIANVSVQVFKNIKAAKALARPDIGWYNVKHYPDVQVPKVKGDWINGTSKETALHNAGIKAFEAELSPQEREALKKYTGPYSGTINKGVQFDNQTKGQTVPAKALRAVKKASVPIPEGIMLDRAYTVGDIYQHDVKVGDVVAQKAIYSTSLTKDMWSGNVRLQIAVGHGVKALPAKYFSQHSNENEVLLQGGQKLLVTGVKDEGGKRYITMLALPTDDE